MSRQHSAGYIALGTVLAITIAPHVAHTDDPLDKLAGDWDLRVFVVGAGQFGGPQCGRSVPGRRMLSVSLASAANGALSFAATCDNGSEYSFGLRHDSATHAYALSVKSTPGISVQDFAVAYMEGQGWQGQRDSITAMITPIEGRLWRGWMIAVLPTAGVGHEDDLKQPFVRADLTRAK